MAELDELLAALMKQAQPRSDLVTPGFTGRLENARPATFLGRMVKPEDTLKSILSRMPSGEFEGGGNVMGLQSLAPAAGAKLLATMHPGGKFAHASPYAFDELAESTGRGLYAGRGRYLSNAPFQKKPNPVLDEYAMGSTYPGGPQKLIEDMNLPTSQDASWTKAISRAKDMGRIKEAADLTQQLAEIQASRAGSPQLGPNIRAFQVKPHETFNMDTALDRKDLDLLRNALLDPDKMQGLDPTARNLALRILSSTGGDGPNMGTSLLHTLSRGLTGDKAGGDLSPLLTRLMKEAGFDSISYQGGIHAGRGDQLHDALNVLNPSILRDFFSSPAR